MAIVGGNIAIMVAGRHVLRDVIPSWGPAVSTWLGLVGLVALIALIAVTPSLWLFAPVLERLSVYTVLLGEVMFAVVAVKAARTVTE